MLDKLFDVYGTIFCYSRLQSQLEVLYSLSDFDEKSLHQTFEYVHENVLINPFDEMYKLFQVILTMLSNTASAEGSFLHLELIHSCKHQERMSLLSLLLIEKRLLLQLQQKQSFYDAVTEKFLTQKQKIELCYR